MTRPHRGKSVSLYAAAAALLCAAPAFADSAEEFFRGKTVTVTVGSGAGGVYGLYARLLSEHIGRHIPGEPTAITNAMPGAGGIKANNYFANVAPKDGTAILVPLPAMASSQVLRGTGIRYDVREFRWLGRMDDTPYFMTTWHTSPVKTFEDARRQETVIAASGRGGQSFINPTLANGILGTQFKVVTGYPGLAEMQLAVERGEAHGHGTVYASLKASKPNWLEEKLLNFLFVFHPQRSPDLPDVPTAMELAENDDDRRILEVISLTNAFGRTATLPPGLPKERVAVLRAAFEKTMADPQFRADAKRRNMELNPAPGEEMDALVERIVSTPEPLLARMREMLGFD